MTSRRIRFVLWAALAALALGACGGSSSTDASSLLKQTFTGSHTVNSGNLALNLTVNPSGSSTLTTPITISFGGPFQSQGQGKLPKSNFSVRLSADGKTGSLGILSTGSAGYVTLSGVSYQLPAATFQKLESSFAGVGSSGSGGSGTLASLGIHPLDWLTHPSVVGKETVGGADTTHIRAGVNVPALLADLNTILAKASNLGAGGASKTISTLSEATRQKIAAAVQSPTFDVWTGNSDKTVRRLTIGLTIPVSGQFSAALGGLRSAQIALTMQYTDLNQPQTIGAPTTIRPYSEFTTRLQSFLAAVQGSVAGAATGGATAPSTAPSGASSRVQSYGQCLANANNDIAKAQKCASLLNGSG